MKSLHIPFFHIISSHATPLHLFQTVHHSQMAHWWACPLYASASPSSLVSFGLMKECVASLSTHETCLPFIWASRYKRLGLGLRLLALAAKPMSNIRSAATTWFVFVPQGNFQTFSPRHKHKLLWYNNATSNIQSAAKPWFALVAQSHLLIFRPRRKHDLSWWHNTTFFVSNIGWFSSLGATIVGSCTFGLLFVLV